MARRDWLTYDDFAGREGEPFAASVGGQTVVPLVLVEATEGALPGGSGPEGQQRRQFDLVFRGPAAPVHPQGTYLVTHADIGELELFLVPLGQDPDGVRYQAAFA